MVEYLLKGFMVIKTLIIMTNFYFVLREMYSIRPQLLAIKLLKFMVSIN